MNLNLNRLVRSASTQEEYCSYIVQEIDTSAWDLDEIYELWDKAKESEMTVVQFIQYYKEKSNEL
tara:strand:- start:10460 stop:10654 length:195 start_codon:yes stop_codon:yes gene_type:complete